MTPREHETALKAARIMRAARKQCGLTQVEIAGQLGISQGALSKLENAILIPSAPQWLDFCQITGIDVESLFLGYLDAPSPVLLDEAAAAGGFRIPKKYAHHRASNVRTLFPFLSYLQSCVGEAGMRDYLRQARIDADFFVNLNNRLNIDFLLDTARSLIAKGWLKPDDISRLVKPVGLAEAHGKLARQYEGQSGALPMLKLLIDNAHFYEHNFRYQIEHEGQERLDISIAPEPHMEAFDYRDDPKLGHFLCDYKQHYFARFAEYGGKPPVRVRELECHYRGASRCVYEMRLAA